MDNQIKQIIVRWFTRANEDNDEFTIFDKFISLWISFNAWIAYGSNEITDKRMINWVIQKENDIYKNLIVTNKLLQTNLGTLKNKTPK